MCVLSNSVMSDSLQPNGLRPSRLLSVETSGREYWSACHFLFQGIFPIQVLNLHPLHWQACSHRGTTWAVLGLGCSTRGCLLLVYGRGTAVEHAGFSCCNRRLSCPIGDQTHVPNTGRRILSHWSAREVPHILIYQEIPLPKGTRTSCSPTGSLRESPFCSLVTVPSGVNPCLHTCVGGA